MRFALVVPYGLNQSGLIVMASRLRDEFLRQGHRTILVAGNNTLDELSSSLNSIHQYNDVNSWLMENCGTYDILLWAGLNQELEGIREQIATSIFLRCSANKQVYFIWERTGSEITLPDKNLLRNLVSNASDGFFAFNKQLINELRDCKVPEKLVFPISPGVDTHIRFIPAVTEAERNDLKFSFKWPSNLVTVLYVGRFVRRKQTDWLVETWIGDRSLQAKAHLVLIGSGFGQKDSVEERVCQLARSVSNVSIVPHKFESDWAPYYRAANMFVLASRREGEPIVLSEAMACGLPIVATKIPGHMALVQSELTGLLFEPGNPTQLLLALNRLIDNGSYRQELGKNARQLAVSQRDISVVANKFLAIFSNRESTSFRKKHRFCS